MELLLLFAFAELVLAELLIVLAGRQGLFAPAEFFIAAGVLQIAFGVLALAIGEFEAAVFEGLFSLAEEAFSFGELLFAPAEFMGALFVGEQVLSAMRFVSGQVGLAERGLFVPLQELLFELGEFLLAMGDAALRLGGLVPTTGPFGVASIEVGRAGFEEGVGGGDVFGLSSGGGLAFGDFECAAAEVGADAVEFGTDGAECLSLGEQLFAFGNDGGAVATRQAVEFLR